MARSGVESARVQVPWAAIEPARGAYDWTALGPAGVGGRRSPGPAPGQPAHHAGWASERPDAAQPRIWPPRDPALAAAFMRRLVGATARAGRSGRRTRDLPRVPVRWWQIWNEPMGRVHWAKRPWAPSFTRFLRATSTAVHDGGPRRQGRGRLAGHVQRLHLVGRAPRPYRAGARPYFDVVSVHPFTNGSVPVQQSIDRIVETLGGAPRDGAATATPASP